MTRREFVQRAAIQFGAALVKCYDEHADGIVENMDAYPKLVSQAGNMASDLAFYLEGQEMSPDSSMEEYSQFWDDDPFLQKDEEDDNGRCVKFKVMDNGEVEYSAVQPADEPTERGGTQMMHDCAKVFNDIRKEHPEINEVHFFM